MLKKSLALLRIDTPVLDNDAGATNDLTSVTIAVNLGETSPFTKGFGIRNLDKRNGLLGGIAERLNELKISGLVDALDKNTELGLISSKSLHCLTKATCKTLVSEGIPEGSLDGVLDGHFAGSRGLSRDLDFVLYLEIFNLAHFSGILLISGCFFDRYDLLRLWYFLKENPGFFNLEVWFSITFVIECVRSHAALISRNQNSWPVHGIEAWFS